jgi:hypothetical protein
MGSSPVDVEQARLAGLAQHGEQLQPYLAPREALYAAVSVRLDNDIKDPPSKLLPKTPGIRGRVFGALERVAPLLEPSETVLTGILNVASGKVWGGGWQSEAGQLIIVVDPLKWAEGSTLGASLEIAVTDRRTLVVFMPRRRTSKLSPGVVAEYSPGQLRNRAEPPPKRQKHRVDVVFPDGSWIAFQAESPEQSDLLRRLLGAPV